MEKAERKELGKKLFKLTKQWDKIVLDTKFSLVPLKNSSNLSVLNKEIEKINERIQELHQKELRIRNLHRTECVDATVKYFSFQMKNVSYYETKWFINFDGHPDVEIEKIDLEHLYEDCLSGYVRIVRDHCSDTYQFEIKDDRLYVKSYDDLY